MRASTVNPLISVIIPTYNHAGFVLEAVETALQQTYPNNEVIVVDDGSSDDTRERLKPYAEVITYHYQNNKGLPGARNSGVALARGDWVAFLDADDLWDKNKLERQWATLAANPDCVMLGGPSSARLRRQAPSDVEELAEVTVFDLLTSTPFGPSSVIMRASVANTYGRFDESLRAVEDRDCWLRVAARGKVLTLSEPLWWYRKHEGQMSRDAERMWAAFNQVLSKFFKEHGEYGELRGVAYAFMNLDAAHCFYDEGKNLRSAKHLVASIWHYPGRLPNHARLLRLKLLVKTLMGPWFHRLRSGAT